MLFSVKFLFANLFLIILINFVYSSVFVTRISKHPDHPNKCWSEEMNHEYDFGESYQHANYCIKMTCRSDYRFDGYGCGTVSVNDPKCVEIEPDLTKDYPECCQKYRCEDGKGGFFTI